MLGRRRFLKLAGVTSAALALDVALRREGGALAAPAAAGTPDLPFALSTPAAISAAALRVRDQDAMAAYYRKVLGLQDLGRSGETLVLGAGGVPLLHLVPAPQARMADPRSAGLFHVAYLMPSRQDLARWLVHASRIRVPVDGFADHNVSEAIYLTDPEGNGIEVYSDRPRESWTWSGGLVTMGTRELDIDAIVALTDISVDSYTAAPPGLRIGHVHLRVGDVPTARAFYETGLGLASTRGDRPDAAFLSSGGYHHHVAVNTWNSRGAGARSPDETGLDWFSFSVKEPALLAGQKARLSAMGGVREVAGGFEARDAWGTAVRLVAA